MSHAGPWKLRRPASHATFPLDDFTSERLLNGWDEIGLTLRHEDAVSGYERRRPVWMPATA